MNIEIAALDYQKEFHLSLHYMDNFKLIWNEPGNLIDINN